MGVRVAEIRVVTDQNKLPWLRRGDWFPVYKQIDQFLNNLMSYRAYLDAKAQHMRELRKEQQNVENLDKFNKDVKIYKINQSTNRFPETQNCHILRRKLKSVEPWVIVRLEDKLLVPEIEKKDKKQIYNIRSRFWSAIKQNQQNIFLLGINGYIA